MRIDRVQSDEHKRRKASRAHKGSRERVQDQRQHSTASRYAIIVAMRIGLNAHLLSQQPGYRAAGIHSYIANLLKYLPAQAPADWRFEAMVGAASSRAIDGVQWSRSRIDTSSPLQRILWEQIFQPTQLRQYDLYHALAFVAPLVLSAPMVVTVYDLSFLHFPDRLSAVRRWYLRAFTALTCRRARRVLAISRSTAADLSRLLGIEPGKIDVTPLGYDKASFRPLPRESIEAFRSRHRLPGRFWLFIGTLEPRKNLPMLLRAFARVPARDRLPLLLAGGKGWMADDVFKTIEALELSDSVKHIGFVPAADLPLWYNCAEAFIYPSVYEGFGLPVLEAMACGTPVITSDVSSLPEVVGEAGLRLPPTDEARWTEALRVSLGDDEWLAAARKLGLERAKRFSWARTAELTLASYQKALLERDSPTDRSEADSGARIH